MSERVFRFFLGAVLIVLLFLQLQGLIYVYVGVLLFEGLTNWRIPLLVSRIRYGTNSNVGDALSPRCAKIPFDAERMLRLLVAVMLILSYLVFHEAAWFFPWFIGFMLFMAGLTNICPMVMGLQRIGFR